MSLFVGTVEVGGGELARIARELAWRFWTATGWLSSTICPLPEVDCQGQIREVAASQTQRKPSSGHSWGMLSLGCCLPNSNSSVYPIRVLHRLEPEHYFRTLSSALPLGQGREGAYFITQPWRSLSGKSLRKQVTPHPKPGTESNEGMCMVFSLLSQNCDEFWINLSYRVRSCLKKYK